MPFKFTAEKIEGVILVEPKGFPDGRGFFFENYKKSEFFSNGIEYEFVQDNTSFSDPDIIRGLHFQAPPYEQGKLVRVITGEILDVAVDIRKGSPTYGQWVSEILNEENRRMLWVPPGFAHGFLTLKKSFVHYKVTKEYNKDSEGGVIWNDPDLRINWQKSSAQLSPKDKLWPTLKDFNSPFTYGRT
ncbi:MAG: dTDP-4-dehydrorhamnose 3,5-epimerase [Candidatus Thermoplasmatota archaeon]|nr:dTDP-4-dehydrorhamnose 3,5-epimerase [Candidatus Thermoplasmatota archaeon]